MLILPFLQETRPVSVRGSWTSGSSHRINQMLLEDSDLLERVSLKGGKMKKRLRRSQTLYQRGSKAQTAHTCSPATPQTAEASEPDPTGSHGSLCSHATEPQRFSLESAWSFVFISFAFLSSRVEHLRIRTRARPHLSGQPPKVVYSIFSTVMALQ